MQRGTSDNLSDVLGRLGLDAGAVAAASGVPLERWRLLEADFTRATVDEIDRVAATLALPPERLAIPPLRVDASDLVEPQAFSAEHQRAPSATLLRILAVAEAAGDLVRLEQMAGEDDRWARFNREVPMLAPPRRRGPKPHHEARHYARALRRHLGLRGPIRSMRDLLAERFPSVAVLYAHLGCDLDLAGVTFADAPRGPTIVLNLDGRNERGIVRRFSLAHELCHLLVDWNRRAPIALLSEYRDESQYPIEQRANAFARRLLCSDQTLQRLLDDRPPEAVARRLVEHYGLHYGAARLSLRQAANADLPRRPATGLDDGRWEAAETPRGVFDFPLPAVPSERRTAVARYAALLYAHGRVSRRLFARLLRVAPDAPLERVVAFFEADIADAGRRLPPLPGPVPERHAEVAAEWPGEFVVMRGDAMLGHTPDEALARRLYTAASRRAGLHVPTFLRPEPRPRRSGPGRLRGRAMRPGEPRGG